ncbi:hypothetical protein K491DRAFT_428094 [Lophiostoma macrostomum CBS 122681]|uniref:Uncharacterized protein n=1 Tax=Lophiostoma macrostomum CBS 122681 TaxID=1314788 RepID=A0A6A6T885_9PLEO|nr:hypothetical protein K491DRAFT_428094 [Lophiostoma macrostomum CBS 122681]
MQMFANTTLTSLSPHASHISHVLTPWNCFAPVPIKTSTMSSTVGDYLFSQLAEMGVRRVLGRHSGTHFLGSIQRNCLRYESLDHMSSTPDYSEIGVFVITPQSGELHHCHHYGSHYFPYRRVVYIVEHSSAQFNRVSESVSQYDFAMTTVLNSPATAASQIRRALDSMLYQNKPVYIGVSMAVAGQLMSNPAQHSSPHAQASPQSRGSASYASSAYTQASTLALSPRTSHPGYMTSSVDDTSPEDEENSAKAAVAMSFI